MILQENYLLNNGVAVCILAEQDFEEKNCFYYKFPFSKYSCQFY